MLSIDERVHVVEYDAVWPALFLSERERIAASLVISFEQLEHIGSTAVPGLAVKPIIDIMLGLSVWPPNELTKALGELGYTFFGEAGVPERLYFAHRGSTDFNLHLVHLYGRHWAANIALREYLRLHEKARRRYEQAKYLAIASGAITLLAYSQAKAQVIAALLQEAMHPQNDR